MCVCVCVCVQIILNSYNYIPNCRLRVIVESKKYVNMYKTFSMKEIRTLYT